MGPPPFSVLVVPVITVVVLQRDANVTSHSDYVPHSVLPDVTNLTLVSTGNTSFTVSWKRPKDDFDYYRVEVTGNGSDDVGPYRVGSCGNGSIIDAHQTQVTCDHIEPCTNVTFTIRTYAKGPPERTSSGVTLDDIFVPGQGPGSPKDVFISWYTPGMSRLRWKQPDEVYGTILGYRITICHRYRSCDVKQETDDCEEYFTSANQWPWLTTRGEKYCVIVKATARCGGQAFTGRPVAAEVVALFSGTPRVNNLALTSAENRSFTVSWEPPMDKFDYYRVQVIGSGGVVNVGSCANGTIIDKKKLSVTCDDVEDCNNLTFKIRMYMKGPPERGYHPAVLRGIFIPGPVPDPPNNVGIVGISASLSRLQWETPENISDNLRDYTVRICHRKEPCDAEQDLTGCVEHRTSDHWFDFETTEGASYCVQVKANTVCGDRVIAGRPATAEVMAPFLEKKAEK
uniref:Fibronectin type-III domain-containing protein n=1 Tax=Rhipicephalus appendiculatus TaxID=34631 RepID=A0A131YX88_RHIAP